SAQNPYSFKAGIQDRASGLVKFGIRWYNATTGTWTQQDTLDTPLNPANANRYAYAANDPINNIDPTGQISGCTIFGGIAAGAGVVAVGALIVGTVTAPTVAGPAVGASVLYGATVVGGVAGGFAFLTCTVFGI
ncbi:RHS repeat-associated protein, partial [Cryobacterium sp. CAN_C3]|uniref:RHS repeat-associated core domain-containing protein n=1 Tax=unclassified Cryobacterium TaxID=2649013 RepID=UPI001A317DCD|nr:RHS repeat-associated protein [Cryobacterium sp. CAN_C3]